jgi:hypothetical protein
MAGELEAGTTRSPDATVIATTTDHALPSPTTQDFGLMIVFAQRFNVADL